MSEHIPSPPKRTVIRWLVFSVGIALFAAAYLHIGHALIVQRNNAVPQILGGDQKHNIKIAVQSRGDLLPHRTDGVVNPLWPWIASKIASDTHEVSAPGEVSDDDRDLFDRGRELSLAITLGFLCLLGFFLARSSFTLAAIFNILLLGGLGALLPRCAYFQPEPVYYILLFLSWLCALALISRPRITLYFVLGVLIGITFLAKSSIQPLLAAFFAVTIYQIVRDFLTKHPSFKRHALIRSAGLLLVIAGFLVTAAPRLNHASERYGSMFHSYPGYWMWMDNFEDAYEWMGQHGDAASLTNIPPEEKPSFPNYWRSHTGSQMGHRLADGFWLKTTEFFYPKPTRSDDELRPPWKQVLEFRGLYLLYLALLLAAVAIAVKYAGKQPAEPEDAPGAETGPALIFVLGTFALCALAYGWYTPIGRGERFMLSLYLPLAFSLTAGADLLFQKVCRRSAKTWFVRSYHIAQLTITGFLVWRVAEILTWPHFEP